MGRARHPGTPVSGSRVPLPCPNIFPSALSTLFLASSPSYLPAVLCDHMTIAVVGQHTSLTLLAYAVPCLPGCGQVTIAMVGKYTGSRIATSPCSR